MEFALFSYFPLGDGLLCVVENEEPPPLVETGRRETGGDLSEWNFDMDARWMAFYF